MENIGAYHLADNPALYEPQRRNNFRFLITDIDGILRPGATGENDTDSLVNAQKYIDMAVVSQTVPTFTQSVIEIRRGNSVMKAAGIPTFNEGSLVVKDYIGADTKSILMAWQNLSYNVETEKVGRMSAYKKDCYLIEYDPDYKMVHQWLLKGCWISGIQMQEYTNESGDEQSITATIQYDKAFLQMPD